MAPFYAIYVSANIEAFLLTLKHPNDFIVSLIENSKEYKKFVSSQNSNKKKPSLFDKLASGGFAPALE